MQRNERASKMRASFDVYAKFKRALYISRSKVGQKERVHELHRPDYPAARELNPET